MASPVPAKSPLHNFSLPQLKWTKNHTNNHNRGRRPAESSSPPSDSAARQHSPLLDSAPRQSPMRDSASESESGYASENRKSSAPESSKNGFLVSSPDEKEIQKSEKKSAGSDVDGAGVKEGRSKIFIRLRTKNKPDDVQDGDKMGTEEEADEFVAKTWNLRPRKPIKKPSHPNGGTSEVGGWSFQEHKAQSQQRPESVRSRTSPEAETAANQTKKQKFSISLSRREIEEDIYAMTRSKPARRPKKRAKAVQKGIDSICPGLWLASITPDSYKVSEAPLKG